MEASESKLNWISWSCLNCIKIFKKLLSRFQQEIITLGVSVTKQLIKDNCNKDKLNYSCIKTNERLVFSALKNVLGRNVKAAFRWNVTRLSNCGICSTYLDRLAEEVNDKLQVAGLISVAEMCKSYDLPGDFLSEVSHKKVLSFLRLSWLSLK